VWLAVIGMTMTTDSLPTGAEGSAYDAQLEAEGGAPPYDWSAKGLPAGLSVDQASGEVSGIPTGMTCSQALCQYSPTFTAIDANGVEVSRALTLALAPEPITPPDGGGTPPDPPQPPIEEGMPTQAHLRIGRVHQTASKLRLVVPGTIARQATGAVVIKGSARIQGRRVTVTSRAQILDGHWRARLPLLWGKRHPEARVHLLARFEGSSAVLGARAKRRFSPGS
jgi:hypothetical protein